jgi:hypothetical protein
MDLSASDVYHVTAERLREVCLEQGLSSGGSVRSLHHRLSDDIKGNKMQALGEDSLQASVPTGLNNEAVVPITPTVENVPHGGGGGQVGVLVELLSGVSAAFRRA